MGDLGCSTGSGDRKGKGRGPQNPLLAFMTPHRLGSYELFGHHKTPVGGLGNCRKGKAESKEVSETVGEGQQGEEEGAELGSVTGGGAGRRSEE